MVRLYPSQNDMYVCTMTYMKCVMLTCACRSWSRPLATGLTTLLSPVNTNPTSHTYDTTAPNVVEDTVDEGPPLVGMGGSPQSMTGGKERQRGNRTV